MPAGGRGSDERARVGATYASVASAKSLRVVRHALPGVARRRRRSSATARRGRPPGRLDGDRLSSGRAAGAVGSEARGCRVAAPPERARPEHGSLGSSGRCGGLGRLLRRHRRRHRPGLSCALPTRDRRPPARPSRLLRRLLGSRLVITAVVSGPTFAFRVESRAVLSPSLAIPTTHQSVGRQRSAAVSPRQTSHR